MRVRGLVGVGEQAKATRAHEAFFINGRSVRCPLLSQALESVCRERVTIGMYPMCALHLTLAPGSVDVNVHPNKLEVRFRDEGRDAHLRGKHAPRRAAGRLNAAAQGGKAATVEEKHTVEQLPLPDIENAATNTTEVLIAQTEVVNQKTEVADKTTKVVKDALPDDAFEALIQAERRRLGISPERLRAAAGDRLCAMAAVYAFACAGCYDLRRGRECAFCANARAGVEANAACTACRTVDACAGQRSVPRHRRAV